MQLVPRFGYGVRSPRCEQHADKFSLWDEDGQRLVLHSDIPVQLESDRIMARFEISAGQTAFHPPARAEG